MSNLTEKIYQVHEGFLCPQGAMLFYSGELYIGKFDLASMSPEGIGILFSYNGNFTISRWKKGKANGFTTFFHKKLDIYEGQMMDGLPEGEWNQYSRIDNTSTSLHFENFKHSLKDTVSLKNGVIESKLEYDLDEICLYLCNSIEGIDYVRYSDGVRYLGMMNNRVSDGIGIYIDENLKFEFGIFRNGQNFGFKIKHFPSEEIGIAPLENGKMNGIGYSINNGNSFLAEFKNDNMKTIKSKGKTDFEDILKDFMRSRMNEKFEFLDLEIPCFQGLDFLFVNETQSTLEISKESVTPSKEENELVSVSVQTSTVMISSFPKPQNNNDENSFSFKQIQNTFPISNPLPLKERAANLKKEIEARLYSNDLKQIQMQKISNETQKNFKENCTPTRHNHFQYNQIKKESVWDNDLPKENSIFPFSQFNPNCKSPNSSKRNFNQRNFFGGFQYNVPYPIMPPNYSPTRIPFQKF